MTEKAYITPEQSIVGILNAIREASGGDLMEGDTPVVDAMSALTLLGKVLVFLMYPIPQRLREKTLDGWITAVKGAAQITSEGGDVLAQAVKEANEATTDQSSGLEAAIARVKKIASEMAPAQFDAKSGIVSLAAPPGVEPGLYITEATSEILLSPEGAAVMTALVEQAKASSADMMTPATDGAFNIVKALQIQSEVTASIFSTVPADIRPNMIEGWLMAVRSSAQDAAEVNKTTEVRNTRMRPN